jgi:hypothetical protein
MVLQIGDRLTAGIRAPTDPAPGETSSHVFRIIIPMACALHMLRDLLSEGLQAGLTKSNGNACGALMVMDRVGLLFFRCHGFYCSLVLLLLLPDLIQC